MQYHKIPIVPTYRCYDLFMMLNYYGYKTIAFYNTCKILTALEPSPAESE